jgi:hypothetical protein
MEKYNEEIETIISSLSEKQDDYFKLFGKYWQGIKTQDSPPLMSELGSKMVAIKDVDKKPEGVFCSWKDMGFDNQVFPFTMEVSEYNAPAGRGYEIRFFYKDDTGEYIKSVGYGVESKQRTIDWSKNDKKFAI